MICCTLARALGLAFVLVLSLTQTAVAAVPTPPTPAVAWSLLASALALLLPVGLSLMAAGGLSDRPAREVTLSLLAAFGMAAVGFWAVGFGLMFGGIGLVPAQGEWPGLDGLVWEWSALNESWGTGWGMAGLTGWGLMGDAATTGAYRLFLWQLPWVFTAVLIPLSALRGRVPPVITALGGLTTGAFIYPLVGNWVWGGGWLANLGHNLSLGHGLVDFAGAGTVHLLGAAVALAGLLAFVPRLPPSRKPAELPPVHLPLLAVLGAVLFLVGGIGWLLSNPLLDWAVLSPPLAVLNLLLAAAGGVLLSLAYTWFVTDRPDPLMAARGLTAATIAAMAGASFLPPWAALLLGLICGLLVPMTQFIIETMLRWNDYTAAVAVHGLGGGLGLLAAGLLADGRWGQGWNGVGATKYLGVVGQGVTGLLASAGFQSDWPGQLQAQLIGLIAIFLFTFLVASLLFSPIAVLARLKQNLRLQETASPLISHSKPKPAQDDELSAHGES
ncbi:MAG TPA: hypothetical protein EYH31_11875 [Anaerolineae bacterium]|nr:hypothetical protein [Anaerolineae bacterium]